MARGDDGPDVVVSTPPCPAPAVSALLAPIYEFREKLKKRKRDFLESAKERTASQVIPNPPALFGLGITSTDPMWSAAMAASGAVDFLWFDLEHTPNLMHTLNTQIVMARGGAGMTHSNPGSGSGPLIMVRVPGPNAVSSTRSNRFDPLLDNNTGAFAAVWSAGIKQVLDAGAHAIAVPQVRTAAEVQRVVRDTRYPPNGCRGFGPGAGATAFGRASIADILKAGSGQQQTQTGLVSTLETNPAYKVFVSVVVETKEAVQNIDAIAAVDGLDCIIIGLNDLSSALLAEAPDEDACDGTGRQGDGAENASAGNVSTTLSRLYSANILAESAIMRDAVGNKIIPAARRHGKYVMFSTRNEGLASEMVKEYGVDMVHFGNEFTAAVDGVKRVKKAIDGQ